MPGEVPLAGNPLVEMHDRGSGDGQRINFAGLPGFDPTLSAKNLTNNCFGSS